MKQTPEEKYREEQRKLARRSQQGIRPEYPQALGVAPLFYTDEISSSASLSMEAMRSFMGLSNEEETKKMKYEIGDRIECVKDGFYYSLHPGNKGTIVSIYREDPKGTVWCVAFDKAFEGGHDCDGRVRDGHGRNSRQADLDEFFKKIKKVEPKKVVELDLKALDAVVLPTEARNEIEAVLKQHKNSQELFEEWGLAETIKYGKGMIFCFHGTPGTGKTWAAQCMANAVHQELLVITAAEIQSQEPGGANRNIQESFKVAKKDNKILFLDECDSLITQRNDVGMIIGSEINTLLTEIEKCEGICILATNRIETLDEALERRITLIVAFEEPDHAQRQEIWKRLLPKKMPLEKDVEIERLADHKLTGGQIKNAVLQAARLALAQEAKKVSLANFEQAIERIQHSKNLMGMASRYRQDRKEDFGKSGGNIDKVMGVDKVRKVEKVKMIEDEIK